MEPVKSLAADDRPMSAAERRYQRELALLPADATAGAIIPSPPSSVEAATKPAAATSTDDDSSDDLDFSDHAAPRLRRELQEARTALARCEARVVAAARAAASAQEEVQQLQRRNGGAAVLRDELDAARRECREVRAERDAARRSLAESAGGTRDALGRFRERLGELEEATAARTARAVKLHRQLGLLSTELQTELSTAAGRGSAALPPRLRAVLRRLHQVVTLSEREARVEDRAIHFGDLGAAQAEALLGGWTSGAAAARVPLSEAGSATIDAVADAAEAAAAAMAAAAGGSDDDGGGGSVRRAARTPRTAPAAAATTRRRRPSSADANAAAVSAAAAAAQTQAKLAAAARDEAAKLRNETKAAQAAAAAAEARRAEVQQRAERLVSEYQQRIVALQVCNRGPATPRPSLNGPLTSPPRPPPLSAVGARRARRRDA